MRSHWPYAADAIDQIQYAENLVCRIIHEHEETNSIAPSKLLYDLSLVLCDLGLEEEAWPLEHLSVEYWRSFTSVEGSDSSDGALASAHLCLSLTFHKAGMTARAIASAHKAVRVYRELCNRLPDPVRRSHLANAVRNLMLHLEWRSGTKRR